MTATLLLLLPLGLVLLLFKLIRERKIPALNVRPLRLLSIVFFVMGAFFIVQYAQGTLPADVGGSVQVALALRLLLYFGCALVFLAVSLLLQKKARADAAKAKEITSCVSANDHSSL
ncbi:MAG: hypothetical protein IJH48_06830 [Oscillospiraceae bacterium]|nr:hypothetical protein [Oscillospiraceae bacterium]